jgi:Zinc-finger of nitric oxide synthase-interacting protein
LCIYKPPRVSSLDQRHFDIQPQPIPSRCQPHTVSSSKFPVCYYKLTATGKRNTSLAFFTSYERSLLRTAWGSQKARLNRDSFLPFGSCSLCLLTARDPVACPQGDLFCRECAINNLLAQRKEIARLEKQLEKQQDEESEVKKIEEEEERERAVREFERVQMGLSKKRKAEDDPVSERENKKRGELSEEMEKAQREEMKKMREELNAEKVRLTASNRLGHLFTCNRKRLKRTSRRSGYLRRHQIQKHPPQRIANRPSSHLYALPLLKTNLTLFR